MERQLGLKTLRSSNLINNQLQTTTTTMKKLLLSAMLLGLGAAGAYAQGQINLDNNVNTSTSPTATTNGLFFLNNGSSTAPVSTDFNVAFYGGTDAANLILLKSFVG